MAGEPTRHTPDRTQRGNRGEGSCLKVSSWRNRRVLRL